MSIKFKKKTFFFVIKYYYGYAINLKCCLIQFWKSGHKKNRSGMREIIIDDRDVSRNFLVCFFFLIKMPTI